MADTVSQLVARVLNEGGFDTDEPTVLGWLTVRQRLMCSRSACFRKTLELGPTLAGQRDYPVPDEVVEILEVLVASYPYQSGRHTDLGAGARGYIRLRGEGGLATRDDDASGNESIALFPTPSQGSAPEPGSPLSVLAVCRPPDLSMADNTTLKVPGEYVDGLVAGAIATGLLRLEKRQDLAAPFDAQFESACSELERQVNDRFAQSGPAQIRVAGINA